MLDVTAHYFYSVGRPDFGITNNKYVCLMFVLTGLILFQGSDLGGSLIVDKRTSSR
jgi:hypothetical protein